jgi:hypothetical protein
MPTMRAPNARPNRLPAAARAQGAPGGLAVFRDAETETLLRTNANPLFRAAGLDANLVRIIVLRDAALNSFVSTGNPMFKTPAGFKTPARFKTPASRRGPCPPWQWRAGRACAGGASHADGRHRRRGSA